ncbi:MAG: GNAT family N-acetyltransferase [Lachnospiraceae bacterium]|nr:GNAT family N-acetyltransferase [Lachnospiraceae bacterium]MDE7201277.1 GNAT family N-acetyltransferase [Lachnospiraceae bacterium]
MSNIKLLEPTMEYEKDIWQFRQEIIDSNDKDKFAGCGNLEECSSAKEWIDTIDLHKNVETCPKDRVPSCIYIAVRERDNRIVGVIDLRYHINHPILGTWGGHMGYYVRPSEREKGYAKEMVRQNLQHCKALDIKKVLITCDEDNLASEKTILANGGIFEKSIEVDGCLIKRYWITISA